MSGSAVEHSLCAFTCQHLTICQTGDKPNIINTSVRSVEGVRGWGVGGGVRGGTAKQIGFTDKQRLDSGWGSR